MNRFTNIGFAKTFFFGCLLLAFSSFPLIAQEEAPKANTAKPPDSAQEEEVLKVKAALPDRLKKKPASPRKLLVFWRSEGYGHSCIALASRTFELMGKKTGAYEAVLSDDMNIFTPERLADFDAVLFNNNTHLEFKNPEHRKALMQFIRSGKGIIGIHAASDNFYNWPEAAAMMGGLFDGHPWHANGTWAIEVEDPVHPINQAFEGQDFLICDEIYQIKGPYSRDTHRVLLRLDMTQACNLEVNQDGVHRKDNDFGVAWLQNFDGGRVFYCSLGHNHAVYWNPTVLAHYLAGIQWALGDLKADATPSSAFETDDLIGNDFSTFCDETGDWMVTGDASLDSSDPTRLTGQPGTGVAINGSTGRTRHLISKRIFGDVQAHIEFMIPKGSNSGVYFMGRYEIQINDNSSDTLSYDHTGGIYQRWNPDAADGAHGYEGPPRIDAARTPGTWQTFDVVFKAPRFDQAGNKTANARFVRVVHNGKLIHENQELSGPTRAALFSDEKALGPLMLQGDHGPVAYRNIHLAWRKDGPKKE